MTEWKLDPAVLKRVSAFWGKQSIDRFASRLNFQLRPFVSRSPSFCNCCFLYQLDGAQFLCFSPFCYNQQGFTEDRTGSIARCNHCPSLDHSNLDSPSSADVGGPSFSPTMLPSATDAANQPSIEEPPTQQVKVNGMQVVWEQVRGVSEKASTVILKSWRGST